MALQVKQAYSPQRNLPLPFFIYNPNCLFIYSFNENFRLKDYEDAVR